MCCHVMMLCVMFCVMLCVMVWVCDVVFDGVNGDEDSSKVK